MTVRPMPHAQRDISPLDAGRFGSEHASYVGALAVRGCTKRCRVTVAMRGSLFDEIVKVGERLEDWLTRAAKYMQTPVRAPPTLVQRYRHLLSRATPQKK